jgi:hypothetical protein
MMTATGMGSSTQTPPRRRRRLPTTTACPGPTSVGFVPSTHPIGLSAGVTYHLSPSLEPALEYFRAMFEWHIPVPYQAGADGEEQNFDVVNLGITYDF